MLAYLGCEDDDFEVVAYLETKPSFTLPFPLSLIWTKEVPRGRAFLSHGYVYVLIVLNLSVAYAFVILATFYSALKSRLKPYEPDFLICIEMFIASIAFLSAFSYIPFTTGYVNPYYRTNEAYLDHSTSSEAQHDEEFGDSEGEDGLYAIRFNPTPVFGGRGVYDTLVEIPKVRKITVSGEDGVRDGDDFQQ
eukprot:gene33351-41154_t